MAMKNASVKHNSDGLLLELLEYGDIVKAISSAIYHPGSMYLGAWIVANHFKWNDDPSLACYPAVVIRSSEGRMISLVLGISKSHGSWALPFHWLL